MTVRWYFTYRRSTLSISPLFSPALSDVQYRRGKRLPCSAKASEIAAPALTRVRTSPRTRRSVGLSCRSSRSSKAWTTGRPAFRSAISSWLKIRKSRILIRPRRWRIKMRDFLIFNQELIALLKAGLPVVHAFELLLERQESPTLRRVLGDVRTRVNAGAAISDAFAEQGNLFPRLYWTSL